MSKFKLELFPFDSKDAARLVAVGVEKAIHNGLTAKITEVPDGAPAPSDEKVDDLSDPTGEKQRKSIGEALVPPAKRK